MKIDITGPSEKLDAWGAGGVRIAGRLTKSFREFPQLVASHTEIIHAICGNAASSRSRSYKVGP